jgi:hypothetical protein
MGPVYNQLSLRATYDTVRSPYAIDIARDREARTARSAAQNTARESPEVPDSQWKERFDVISLSCCAGALDAFRWGGGNIITTRCDYRLISSWCPPRGSQRVDWRVMD